MQFTSKQFDNAEPVYDIRAIMKAAHESVKLLRRCGFTDDSYAVMFADRLAYEWQEAKRIAREAFLSVSQRRVVEIRKHIALLQNKPWGVDISRRENELKTELAALAAT
jgi:hypothetical protein